MFWYDGKIVDSNLIELEIDNPGLLYGATVFTTMRIYQQSLDSPLTNLAAHCDRLKTNLAQFNWPLPNWDLVVKGCQSLIEHFPVLRITIFPDGRELIMGRNLPVHLAQKQLSGIKGWLAPAQFQRTCPSAKTGNYLAAWLALQAARKLQADEAILVNEGRNWLETSTGNLWGYGGEIWFTPRLEEGILPGISRKTILEKANFEIRENIWHGDFVKNLEAIAYSNCVVELIPFKEIFSSTINLQLNPHHPSLKQLKQLFG